LIAIPFIFLYLIEQVRPAFDIPLILIYWIFLISMCSSYNRCQGDVRLWS